MCRPKKISAIVFLTFFNTSLLAEIQPQVSGSLYAELEDGELSVEAASNSSVVFDYKTKNLTFDSTISFDISTALTGEDISAQWQTVNQANYRFSPIQTDIYASYSHLENEPIFDDDEIINDQYAIGARKLLAKNSVVTRSISSEYQYSAQETDSGVTDSESASAAYRVSRNLRSRATLTSAATYRNYLENDSFSVGVSSGYSKPYRKSIFSMGVGLNFAEADNVDSTDYTGSLSWRVTPNSRFNYELSASKNIEQASSLLYSEVYSSSFEADELVDVTSLSASFGSQVIPNRLLVSGSYKYSWIESVFDLAESSSSTDRSEEDYGALNLNYQMTERSDLSTGLEFSLRDESISVVGDITYNRYISRNGHFFASISNLNDNGEPIVYQAGYTVQYPGRQ